MMRFANSLVKNVDAYQFFLTFQLHNLTQQLSEKVRDI